MEPVKEAAARVEPRGRFSSEDGRQRRARHVSGAPHVPAEVASRDAPLSARRRASAVPAAGLATVLGFAVAFGLA